MGSNRVSLCAAAKRGDEVCNHILGQHINCNSAHCADVNQGPPEAFQQKEGGGLYLK